MVLKKRIYNGGFDGLRAPVVPKAPRSLRRNSRKKSSEGSEICAFELLAAVAGKLLQESESSTSSTGPEVKEQTCIPKDGVKQEPLELKVKTVRLDYLDQGSCAESEFIPESTNLELKLEPPSKDLPHSDNDSGLEHDSIVTTSDFLKKVGTDVKLEAFETKIGVDNTPNKSLGASPSHGDLSNSTEMQKEAVEKQTGDMTVKSRINPHPRVLNKSYSSVHLPFYRDPIPKACFPRHRGNVKIGIRDDDENSFSYNPHSTKLRAFRSQSRAGYRRLRKMLTSRYWKAAPKLKDYELSNTTSGGVKPLYHNRRNLCMRERCQAEAASKRRKLFHHNSKPDYVQEASSESISNLPGGDKRRPPAAASNRVKFSIKSFKVPELYVEIPETATVGSLKRTVMEAVTAILGGELRVGVLLQGKKVRDDNRTLQQTGISLNSDTLGFTLEPSTPQASLPPLQKEPPLLPPSNSHLPPAMSPAVGFSNSPPDPPLVTSLEKDQETKVSTDETEADAKALVPIPEVNPEALSIVPMNHKLSKRSELSQRRTRRPFSVSEVEALVEAVETLGTGRWRDVKIRAFDDANHRTYVDLKDKWKTLVHTASISPQQRRGEPVPQDLLDRVLAAHAFWSQHQSKPHGKHPVELVRTVGTPVKVCL